MVDPVWRLSSNGFSGSIYNINKITEMSSIQVFQNFLSKLGESRELRRRLEWYEDCYTLKKYRIADMNKSGALALLENITKKYYKNYERGQSGVWLENELRLFIWILVCYMESEKKCVREFSARDWRFFSSVMYVKQEYLFEYQARIMLDYSQCLYKWSGKEDSLLMEMVRASPKPKWNQIAKLVFVGSGRAFTRTSKQCRERWLNHLDPCKTKLGWTLEEYRCLFDAVVQKGKKWAAIVGLLRGKRSEHSIKNKYNSVLGKQTKLTPELTEKQNCLRIIERIAEASENGWVGEGDEVLFGDHRRAGQSSENSEVENEETLQDKDSLNFHLNNIMVTPSYCSSSSVFLLQSETDAPTSQSRQPKQAGQDGEDLSGFVVDEGRESLMSLGSLNMLIWESELEC